MSTDRKTYQPTNAAAYESANRTTIYATYRPTKLPTNDATYWPTYQTANRTTDHATNYATNWPTYKAANRATKWTARAFEGKVDVWKKDWPAAIAVFEEYYEQNPNEYYYIKTLAEIYRQGHITAKAGAFNKVAQFLEAESGLKEKLMDTIQKKPSMLDGVDPSSLRRPASLENY